MPPAMDVDEPSPLIPTNTAARFADITHLSVSELRDYRQSLEAEIVRVDGAIRAKQASLDAAAAFFKS